MTQILSQNAEVGKIYKSSVFEWEVKVLRHEEYDGKIISTLIQIIKTGREIPIPANSILVEIDKKQPKVSSEESIKNNSIKKVSTNKKQGAVMNNKNPRSKIIDVELAKVKKKEKPDYNKIASAVISAGKAKEDERKKVIFQVRARHRWYKKGLKVNPEATDAPKKKSAKAKNGKSNGKKSVNTSSKETASSASV